MNKRDRKSRIKVILFILPLTIIGLTGCNPKDSSVIQVQQTNREQSEVSNETTKEQASETKEEIDKDTETVSETDQGTTEETEQGMNTAEGEKQTGKDADNREVLSQLIGLLGLTKEKLSDTIGDDPKSIDEGGVEFTNYGIRVWFGEDSLANQIYILNNDMEINGLKIGDPIRGFEKKFGEPVKDNNGDAHFKYKDIYLSVNYDTDTKEIFGIYILKEDF